MKGSKRKIGTRVLAMMLAFFMVLGSKPLGYYSVAAEADTAEKAYTFTVTTGEDGSKEPVAGAKVTVNVQNGTDVPETITKTTDDKGVAKFSEITSKLPEDNPDASPVVFTYLVEMTGYQSAGADDTVTVSFADRIADKQVTLTPETTGGEKLEQAELVLQDNGNAMGKNWQILCGSFQDKTHTLTVTGGSGNGAVTFGVNKNDGVAFIDENTGALTVKRPGSFVVTVTKAGDDTYNEAKAECQVNVKLSDKEDVFTFSVAGKTITENPDTPGEMTETVTAIKDAKVTVNVPDAEADSATTITTNEYGVAALPAEIMVAVNAATKDAPISYTYTVTAEGYKTSTGTIMFPFDEANADSFNPTDNKDVVLIEKEIDNTFKFANENPGQMTYSEGATFTNTASSEHAPETGDEGIEPVYTIKDGSDCAELSQEPAEKGTLIIKKAGTVTVQAELAERASYLAVKATYTLTIVEADQEDFYLKYGSEKLKENHTLTYDENDKEYQFSTEGGSGTGAVTYALKDEAGNVISGVGEDGQPVADASSAAKIDQNGKVTVTRPCSFTVAATKAGEEGKYKEAEAACKVLVREGTYAGKYTLTITNEEGNPVKDASVTVTIPNQDDPVFTGKTDANGVVGFEASELLGNEDEIKLSYTASTDGYKVSGEITINEDNKAWNSNASLKSLDKVTVKGTVKDSSTKALIEGAAITISSYGKSENISTGSDGTYSVSLYAGQEYNFKVEKKNYKIYTKEKVSYSQDAEFNIELAPKEVDSAFDLTVTGEGVEGGKIEINSDSATIEVGTVLTFTTKSSERDNPVQYTITDVDGVVEKVSAFGKDSVETENPLVIRAVKKGTITVTATIAEDEYQESTKTYKVTIETGKQADFHFKDTGNNKITEPLVLNYAEDFSYTVSTGGGYKNGKITYALEKDGNIISGINKDGDKVEDGSAFATITDKGEISVKRPCDFYVIARNAGEEDKYAAKEIECHVIVKAANQEEAFTVTVGNATGEPIEAANVEITVQNPASSETFTDKTDKDGSVAFSELTTLLDKLGENASITISYKITAAGYDDIPKEGEPEPSLTLTDKTGNLDVIMSDRKMVKVSGVVKDMKNNPIKGATITVGGDYDILPSPITSGEDGKYEVELYVDVPYTFTTEIAKYKSKIKTVTFTDVYTHDITLEMKDKDTTFAFATESPAPITYGDNFSNVAKSTAQPGNAGIIYSVVEGTKVVEVDSDTGEITTLKAGKAVIEAKLAESDNYLEATATYTLTVNLAGNAGFGFNLQPGEPTTTYKENLSVSLLEPEKGSNTEGAITYALSDAFDADGNSADPTVIAEIDGTTNQLKIKQAGKITITATQKSDGRYETATASYTLTIKKATPTLKFDKCGAGGTVSTSALDGTYTNKLSGGTTYGKVEYSIVNVDSLPDNSGPCASIDSATGKVTLYGKGSVTIKATVAGNDCYTSKSATYTLTITRGTQSALSFAVNTPSNVTFNRNNNTYNLKVEGGSGTGAITYVVVGGTGKATIGSADGKLKIDKPGTITIRATKAADNQYNDTSAERTITVDKDTQTLAFDKPTPENLIYGNAFANAVKEVPDTADANGKGYGTGAITYSVVSGEEIASVDANGRLTFADAKVGTVVIKAEKAGDDFYHGTEQTYTLNVGYLPAPQMPYTITGATLNDSGWYTGNATIKGADGHQLSYANNLNGTIWSDTLAITDEGQNPRTIYLKNAQGITDAIDIPKEQLLIDKTNPEGLSISYSTSVLSSVIEALTFGFYQAPVTVTLQAVDTVSGINSFTYSYELQAGASAVNQGATDVVVGRESMSFDGNRASYSFEIPPQFRGHVSFTATDVSGRETSYADGQVLVADAIAPTANITYSDPIQNANGIAYYDGTVQATISVTEANFYSEDVQVSISKDGGTPYPVQPNWSQGGGDEYIGTFDIQEDGDYIVTVEYQDRSGNEMAVYTSEQLTVDMTQPVISVEGIENASANREDVIGFAVTVEDINIDRESFLPVLMATIRNKEGKFETVDLTDMGTISTVAEGESYVYTVENLDADAIYTLTCGAKDYAGNEITEMVAAGSGEPLTEMRFSVNRDGSTYDIDEATRQINGTFVQEPVDIVIYEINADALSNLKIILFKNNQTIELVEGVDYQVRDNSGEGQWYQYEYIISKSLFEDDGIYRIVTHTQDAAGNVAENTLDTKATEISFGVDKTNPNVIFTNLESETTYPVENLDVVMDISDNLKLESVVAYLDGEEYKAWSPEDIQKMTEEQTDFTFGVSGDSIQAHSVRVVSTDAAGNAAVSEIQNFYVTTNRWIQFYNNKPLFFGTVAGGVVIIGGIAAVVVVTVRKKARKN